MGHKNKDKKSPSKAKGKQPVEDKSLSLAISVENAVEVASGAADSDRVEELVGSDVSGSESEDEEDEGVEEEGLEKIMELLGDDGLDEEAQMQLGLLDEDEDDEDFSGSDSGGSESEENSEEELEDEEVDLLMKEGEEGSKPADDSEEEDEEEEDDGIALDDLSDDNLSLDADAVPRQKIVVDNKVSNFNVIPHVGFNNDYRKPLLGYAKPSNWTLPYLGPKPSLALILIRSKWRTLMMT
jgi:rRNA-processing protein EBP2